MKWSATLTPVARRWEMVESAVVVDGRGLHALHKPILFAYLWFHAASRAIYI